VCRDVDEHLSDLGQLPSEALVELVEQLGQLLA
jgi:hypothetical protein